MKFSGWLLVGTLLSGVLARGAEAATVKGKLLYEKVPATLQGLDLQHPVKTPAAEIRIELRSADQKTVLAHTTTADDGRFQFDAPANAGRVSFVVMAELGNIQVRDPATD